MRRRVSVAASTKSTANESVVGAVNNHGTKSVEGARRLGQSCFHSKAHPLNSSLGGNTVDCFRSSEAMEIAGSMATVTVTVTITMTVAISVSLDVG